MLTVTICIGSSCHLKGSQGVVEAFSACIQQKCLEDQVELAGCFCSGDCVNGVCVHIGADKFTKVTKTSVPTLFDQEILPRLSR